MSIEGGRRVPPFGKESMTGGWARDHKKGIFVAVAAITAYTGTLLETAGVFSVGVIGDAKQGVENNAEVKNRSDEVREGAAGVISPNGDTETSGDGETVPGDIASILGGGVSGVPDQPAGEQGSGQEGAAPNLTNFGEAPEGGIGVWQAIRQNCEGIGPEGNDGEIGTIIDESGYHNKYNFVGGAAILLACEPAN